jgi:FkbM family methyltransferase
VEDLVTIRDEKVEGIGPWIWPIADSGGWIGPSEEFAAIRDHMLPHIKHRRLIVQAGGCCGMYPRLWSEIFQSVYTFEPSPLNWHCLQKNCVDDKIQKFNMALGEHSQTGWLRVGNMTNVGENTMHIDDGNSIKVIETTIDHFGLPYCDAIQLDIEGYEAPALLGAINTISIFHPVICLETKNPNDASHAILSGLGYKVSSQVRNDTIFIPI